MNTYPNMDKDNLLEKANTLLGCLNMRSESREHAFRVSDSIKQFDDSVYMQISALLHDLPRLNLINGYKICEEFGPNVLQILTDFATVIWVEKTSSHDNKFSDFRSTIANYSFVALDLKDGILLRAIDWIDNKKMCIPEKISLSQKKIGLNFYIPLLDYLEYFP